MKDYKKILEGVANIIDTTERSDIGFVDICNYLGEIFPELAESKDLRIKTDIQYAVHSAYGDNSNKTKDIIAYLEKLSEQKPAEWTAEDKVMLDEIIDFFENGTVKLQHDLSLYASWLNDIKNRVQPQPKQERSEENKKIISDVVGFIHDSALPKDEKEYYVEKLLSFSFQKQWKPSEEMLEALYRAVPQNVKAISEDEILLGKLYLGLKYGKVLSK